MGPKPSVRSSAAGEAATGQPATLFSARVFISLFSISKADTFSIYKLNASPIMTLIMHLGVMR